ncbi:MAG: pro-sigmaK processing inhibitor BofA family protein, partial [Desulfocucumaceae bacterium]
FMTAAFMLRYMKVLYRVLVWTAVGTVIILLADIALDQVGLHIALNPATVLAVGVLKIPGALLLVLLNYYFA